MLLLVVLLKAKAWEGMVVLVLRSPHLWLDWALPASLQSLGSPGSWLARPPQVMLTLPRAREKL